MSKEAKPGIGFFERYLTIWVIVCMAVYNGPLVKTTFK